MSVDERRLIAECLQGRTEAFGELVRRYQDRLFNAVYRYLGNAEDARDVVQESFLLAYQALDRFKGDSRFYTWLYRIAFNTAVSWKRKQHATWSLDSSRPESASLEPVDDSEQSQPGLALERAEQERLVQAALNKLSPEHRLVLVLKDIEGQKYEAIAAILEIPIGTVRSRLHRARFEMRELLRGEFESPS